MSRGGVGCDEDDETRIIKIILLYTFIRAPVR